MKQPTKPNWLRGNAQKPKDPASTRPSWLGQTDGGKTPKTPKAPAWLGNGKPATPQNKG